MTQIIRLARHVSTTAITIDSLGGVFSITRAKDYYRLLE